MSGPRQTVEQLRANLYGRHSIGSIDNAVTVCGWMTGHVVRPIAFCETPEYATLLARGLIHFVAAPAVPGIHERSAEAPSQEDGGSAGPGAVDTPTHGGTDATR